MDNNLSNQDSFSVQSENYAKYRPHYPATLFAELASLCASKQRALDCATGNGQSAIALTKHFKEVIATDVSQQQIAQAITHPQVSYLVVAAEKLDFPAAYFDLITVAQAIHWFNLPEFYQKVKYIGKPGAIIAAWAYDLFKINNQIDEIIQDILLKPIEAFWAEGNKLISAKYQSIDFPFTEISLPTFQLQVEWNLAQLLGYIKTWSAVKRYNLIHQLDPTLILKTELGKVWGDSSMKKLATMELYLRVGRI